MPTDLEPQLPAGALPEGATSPAPAPAAAPAAPSAAAPASPSVPPSDGGAASSPAAGADAATAQEIAAYKALGLSPDQLRAVIGEHAQFSRAYREYEDQQRDAYARSPEGQRTNQRREAFMGLLVEAVGEKRAHAMLAAADDYDAASEERSAERTRYARTTFNAELSAAGVDTSNNEAVTELENLASGLIQSDDRLNAMYFNPSQRAEAVKQATSLVVTAMNRTLIAAGASDLRTLASRRSAVPRSSRGGSFSPATPLEPKSKPGTLGFRREWQDIGSKALDAVFDSLSYA